MNPTLTTPNALKVLVVDDASKSAQALALALENANYTTKCIPLRKQALEQIHVFQPELILLNRDLPDGDGLELCREIKASPKLDNIFVILYSSIKTTGEDQADGFDAGAEGYMNSPVSTRELLARVESFARIIRRIRSSQTSLEETIETLVEVRGKEAHFRTLFENAPDAFYLMEGDTYVDANEKGVKAFGCVNKQALIGKHPWDFSPETQPNGENSKLLASQRLSEALKGHPLTFEWLHELKDGTQFYCEVSMIAEQGASGQPLIRVICRDTTERERLKHSLRVSNERRDEAIKAANVGLFSIDFRTNETYFSPIWKSQIGYEDHDFPNDFHVVEAHIHSEDLPEVQDQFKKILENEASSWEQLFRIRHKDNSYRWILCRARVVEYAEGKAARLLGSHLDVTERVQTRQALKEALEFQQEAIEAGNVGLWHMDSKTKEVFYSVEWKRQIGYADDEFASSLENWEQHLHPDDLEKTKGMLYQSIADKQPRFEATYRLRHKDGSYRWILTRGSITEVTEGDSVKLLGSHIDVTEQIQKQEALETSERHLSLAQRMAGMGSWEWIPATDECFWSKEVFQIWGYAPDEVEPNLETVASRIHPDYLELWKENLRACLEDGKEHNIEMCIIRPDGSDRWVAAYGNTVRDENGEVTSMAGVTLDIDKRKRLEIELESTNLQLREAVKSANVGLWDWDILRNKVKFSPEWKHQIGYEEHEISDDFSEWESRVHPNDLAKYKAQIEQSLRNVATNHEVAYRFRHKDGSYRQLLAHACVFANEAGKAVRMMGSHVDITSRVQMQEDLRERERQLFTLLNNLPGMAYRCENDASWTMRFVSSGAKSLTEYSAAEMIGNQKIAYSEVITPEDRDRVRQVIEEGLASVGRFELEYSIRTASGKIKHVWEQGIGLRDEHGAYSILEGIIMDVTERDNDRKHLQHLTAVLRSLRAVNQLITHTTEPRTLIHKATETLVRDRGFQHAWCILVDDDGQIVDHAEAVTNRTALEVGKHLSVGKIPACYERTLQASQVLSFVPDSSVCRGCCFHDETSDQVKLCARLHYEGKTYGMLSVAIELNVSRIDEEKLLFQEVCNDLGFALSNIEREVEKRQIYDDMVIAKDQAESANCAKNDFLAVMNHEMRTPLNPIMGFASMMLENASGENATLLQCILDASNRMLLLVNRILEYSELESSSVPAVMKNFKLVDACQTAFEEQRCADYPFTYQFHNGGLGLIAIDETCEVACDSNMLIRILGNLLQNACKYTKSGTVTFTIGQEPRKFEPAVFQFIIEDTGIGMDEAVAAKYFEAFTQADSSYTRPYEGIGLGLAISNKLVAILNGTIEVSSKLGVGTRFTVSLPMQIHSHVPSISQTPHKVTIQDLQFSAPLKILIVEDDLNNSMLLKTFISKLGGVPVLAENGSVAVEICRQQTFDVILMDIRMPIMDGFEATERIKATDQLNCRTPIIALTANTTDSVEHKCLRLGMLDFIKKPIKIRGLYSALEAYATRP